MTEQVGSNSLSIPFGCSVKSSLRNARIIEGQGHVPKLVEAKSKKMIIKVRWFGTILMTHHSLKS